jgi:hypothetical protein
MLMQLKVGLFTLDLLLRHFHKFLLLIIYLLVVVVAAVRLQVAEEVLEGLELVLVRLVCL